MIVAADENTSGRKDGRVPPEIDGKWNWGAFLFAPIFAGINRLWLWLGVAIATAAVSQIPGMPDAVSSAGGIALAVMLAKRGNALAWRSRRWEGVDHFRRTQRRTAWLSLVAVAVVVVVVAATYRTGDGLRRSAEPTAYDAHGISFTYPAGWGLDAGGTLLVGAEQLHPLWIDALFPNQGDGLIALFARDFGSEVTSKQLERQKDAIAERFAGQGQTLQSEPVVLDVGGLPALRLESDVGVPGGERTLQRVYLIVSGRTWVFLKCQYPEGDTLTLTACDSIIGTFHVTNATSIASPSTTAAGPLG